MAAVVASPLVGQVPTRARRDSTVLIRIRPGMEDHLLVRLDSLRRALDLEPLGSADRAQLKLEVEKLVSALTDLSRSSGNVGLRLGATGAEAGSTAGVAAIARMLARGGEGLRQFPFFAPRGWIGITAEGPWLPRVVGDSEYIRYLDHPSIV